MQSTNLPDWPVHIDSSSLAGVTGSTHERKQKWHSKQEVMAVGLALKIIIRHASFWRFYIKRLTSVYIRINR